MTKSEIKKPRCFYCEAEITNRNDLLLGDVGFGFFTRMIWPATLPDLEGSDGGYLFHRNCFDIASNSKEGFIKLLKKKNPRLIITNSKIPKENYYMDDDPYDNPTSDLYIIAELVKPKYGVPRRRDLDLFSRRFDSSTIQINEQVINDLYPSVQKRILSEKGYWIEKSFKVLILLIIISVITSFLMKSLNLNFILPIWAIFSFFYILPSLLSLKRQYLDNLKYLK